MIKKTSLKDIAKKVGVSTALVSYVLNNKKTGRIRKEVADKIKQTAIELNYSANLLAKSLKTRKTFTLGLIVSDIANPFSSSLARIIEDEAETMKYNVIFGSSDESAEKLETLIHLFVNRQVDGLMIAPTPGSEKQIQFLMEQQVPFVLIDRKFENLQTSYVILYNEEAAFDAVDHLIKNGYTKVALVSFETSLQNIQARKKGYLDALMANGIVPRPEWIQEVEQSLQHEEVNAAMAKLTKMAEPVDAIFFATNQLATLGLGYIVANNIKVPDEVAIVVFDEMAGADFFYAPLTYVKQPLVEIGQQATQLLIALISKQKAVEQLSLNAELIIRQSSAPRS